MCVCVCLPVCVCACLSIHRSISLITCRNRKSNTEQECTSIKEQTRHNGDRREGRKEGKGHVHEHVGRERRERRECVCVVRIHSSLRGKYRAFTCTVHFLLSCFVKSRVYTIHSARRTNGIAEVLPVAKTKHSISESRSHIHSVVGETERGGRRENIPNSQPTRGKMLL